MNTKKMSLLSIGLGSVYSGMIIMTGKNLDIISRVGRFVTSY